MLNRFWIAEVFLSVNRLNDGLTSVTGFSIFPFFRFKKIINSSDHVCCFISRLKRVGALLMNVSALRIAARVCLAALAIR